MVEPAFGVIELGLKLTVTPAGAPVALSVTEPLKPVSFNEVMVKVVLEPPAVMVFPYGVTPSLKLSMLLIQEANRFVASTSTRLESSGGIWMLPAPRVEARLK